MKNEKERQTRKDGIKRSLLTFVQVLKQNILPFWGLRRIRKAIEEGLSEPKTFSLDKVKNEMIQEADRVYEFEIQRRTIIENKASSLLHTMGLIITLLTFLIGYLIGKGELIYVSVAMRQILMGAILLVLIYFFISVRCALKVLELLPIHIITPNDLGKLEVNNQLQQITKRKMDETYKNEEVTRIKSNYLWAAQRCFRNGVIILLIIIFLVILTSLSCVG
ncbi:hypothetical protein HKBW3S43_00123 [Candidatus Hakubella thermalkaliphila]|uniref:Uncharacterized protein n=1 Tax=Candidatus Hakubella thermalkaliphila TaxID=2754717 RepID=A0A6V8QBD4_9ACTN|nr:hypothetical protein [Candidatus Hakubella thermalkaliphila]GFP34330.1 hypothetical protein HKBW3S43_00123 [Candidatus Hakubella thermalkaliphila]GFP41710.1 hypothetical protein HKBW3C_00836 [Candidatus Hakubella thermalkaliphila]